jgi:hypothetical protein
MVYMERGHILSNGQIHLRNSFEMWLQVLSAQGYLAPRNGCYIYNSYETAVIYMVLTPCMNSALHERSRGPVYQGSGLDRLVRYLLGAQPNTA